MAESPAVIRIIVHAGNAVGANLGPGRLVRLVAGASWTTAREICARAVGPTNGRLPDEPRLLLLPDLLELNETDLLRENDKVVVCFPEEAPSAAAGAPVRSSPSPAPATSPSVASPPPASPAARTASPARPMLGRASAQGLRGIFGASPGNGGALGKVSSGERLRRAVKTVIAINRMQRESMPGAGASDESLPATPSPGSEAPSPRKDGASPGVAEGKASARWRRRSDASKSVDTFVRQLANMYGYESERRHISSSDESLAWHMLHPEHGLKLGWDLAALLFVVYFAFTIPMRLGFDMEISPPEATLEFVMDLFFLVDILVSFRTAYKENGILVRDSASIAHHYLRTWFVFDVVASFPLDWIIPAHDIGPSAYAFTMDVHEANYTTALEAAAAATELDAAAALAGMGSAEANQANRFVRLLRLVKLFRTLRLLKLFPRIVQLLETSVALNPSVVRFIRSIVFLLLVWHTLGCVYFYMVRDEYGGIVSCVAPPDPRALLSMSLGHDVTRDGYPVGNGSCYVHLCICGHAPQDESSRVVLPGTDVSWYDPFNPDQWVTPPRSASWSISTKYWQSVFWAVTVTTGIGYDILPRSNQEVVFTTLMTIVGLIMYSIVIGSASSALTNLDSSATQQRQVLDRVSAYMRSRHVPMFFQRIIRDFYRHMWSSISMQEDVFEDLPPSLKHRLEVVMNRDLIDRIPVLQTLSADVFIRLVQRLEHHTFLPGEYIARQGEAGGALFFTLRGRVDAVLPNGVTVFQTFVPGSFFGEGSLLERRKRDASYRAVDFVDLLSLGRADFDELRVVAPRFLASLTAEHAARQKERMRVEREFAQQLAAAALGTDSTANAIQGGRTGARSRRESLGAMLDDSCASIAVESLVSCCPTDRLRHTTRRWLLCRACWGRGGCCADESETAESGMDITSRASGMWDSVRSLSTRFGGMFHASTRSVGVEPSPAAPHGVATTAERSVSIGAVASASVVAGAAAVANAPLTAEDRANPAPALRVRHRSLKEPTGTHVVLSAPPPPLTVRSARSSHAVRGDEDRVAVLVWQAGESEAGAAAGGDVEEPTHRLPTPTDISASAEVVALPGAVSGSSEAADAVPEPGGGVDPSVGANVEQPEDCDHREREGRADPASRTATGEEGADAVSHDPAWHEAMKVLGDLEREALAHCSVDEK